MAPYADVVAAAGAPTDEPREVLDASDLPPPEPLRRTLNALATADPGTVLVQVNDRAPQHLYPKLEDRGYRFETCETDASVVTVIWEATE
jgi:TusA-related sulfurtransferase